VPRGAAWLVDDRCSLVRTAVVEGANRSVRTAYKDDRPAENSPLDVGAYRVHLRVVSQVEPTGSLHRFALRGKHLIGCQAGSRYSEDASLPVVDDSGFAHRCSWLEAAFILTANSMNCQWFYTQLFWPDNCRTAVR
jgi:hypothetical protein